MKGGYIIIDFKKYGFTDSQQASIEGIYERISNGYHKATLVSNLIVNDEEYPDTYVTFLLDSLSYVGEIRGGLNTITITITQEDNVTISVESDDTEE